MAQHAVFVYGTLKSDQANGHLLQNCGGHVIYVCRATTVHPYPLVVASWCNIPFMVYKQGTGKAIHGEVYQLDDVALNFLDLMEGHPNYYERLPVDVVMETDIARYKQKHYSQTFATHTCHCYFLTNYKPEILEFEYLDTYDNLDMPATLKYVEIDKRRAERPHPKFDVQNPIVDSATSD